jgi:hypothetical protein
MEPDFIKYVSFWPSAVSSAALEDQLENVFSSLNHLLQLLEYTVVDATF